MRRFRINILCEDRRSERFLREACKARDIEVLDVKVAPSGRGAASAWVLEQYASLVKLRRSKRHQQHLGLLVHIDGDDQGVEARKLALDRRLAEENMPLRDAEEPVAVVVPTWCIETWLLHLSGLATPGETAKLKRDPEPTYRDALAQLAASETKHIRGAVALWRTAPVPLPSLLDARQEAQRVGL